MTRKVVVGGPIQNAIERGLFDKTLRLVITTVISHLERSGFTVHSAHVTEKFGSISERFTPPLVTRRDFDWISNAFAYIAVLPTNSDGRPMASSGTSVELGWASVLQIPTTIVWDEARSEAYGHLIRGLHMITPVEYVDIAACIDNPEVLTDALITVSSRR
jgi:nucleoside 2-deoxyribosyltransferase